MTKLTKARATAFTYHDRAETIKVALEAATSEKEFIRLQKRLAKTNKLIVKWRDKALNLDGLPDAATKLPPVPEVITEEYMGPLFNPKEVRDMQSEFESLMEFQGNPEPDPWRGK